MDNFEIIGKFQIDGDVLSIEPFGNGHINKTFKVITSTEKYLFQGVNSYAFHNIDDLMRNIYIVSNHLSDLGELSLEIIKTKNRKLYLKDGDYYYRVYKYIRKSLSYEKLDKPELVVKTAQAFAKLHKNLADLDSCLIAETIEDFHNTPKRFQNLMNAISEDPCGRLSECGDLLPFIFKNKRNFSKIQKGLDDGSIPERIAHNDPKINNILFDRETEEVRCIIDLDTVMPGSCLFDFGDALRSLFTGDNESSRDTSLLKVNLETYELYTKGYLSEMKNTLTEKELELLPNSVFTLACELGMRFLDDYLHGDKYFHINFEDENLVRAKGQFALAEDILKNMAAMKEITEKYAK